MLKERQEPRRLHNQVEAVASNGEVDGGSVLKFDATTLYMSTTKITKLLKKQYVPKRLHDQAIALVSSGELSGWVHLEVSCYNFMYVKTQKNYKN